MTKEAAAIVRIDPARVRDAFAAAEGKEDVRIGDNGEAFAIVALDDATVVHLGIPIASEPVELADRLEDLLGELLDEHDDDRGVPIYPSSHALQARTWEGAIEELGEAADWVSLDEGDAGGLGDVLKAFGVGEKELEEMEGLLAGADRSALLSSAMRMAKEMAESGALEELAKRMRILQGASGEDAWKALDRGTAADRLRGMNLDELAQEARRMLDENPELGKKIRSVFDAPADDEERRGEDEEKE